MPGRIRSFDTNAAFCPARANTITACGGLPNRATEGTMGTISTTNMNRSARIATLSLLALTALPAFGADPKIGSSRSDVLSELGKPTASFSSAGREVMMFSRGKIVLEDGVVSKVELKTKEQFAEEERRRAEEELRRLEDTARKLEEQRRAAIEFAERKKTGDAELAKLVNTTEWIKFTGDERLELLARFAKKHPEADLTLELQFAKMKRDRENQDRDRIKNLELRLAEAERRAEAAEARAGEATRIASRAESRAEDAERTRTIYLPEPVVTHVYYPQPQPQRPAVTIVKPNVPAPIRPCPPQSEKPAPVIVREPRPPVAKPEPRPAPPAAPDPSRPPKRHDENRKEIRIS